MSFQTKYDSSKIEMMKFKHNEFLIDSYIFKKSSVWWKIVFCPIHVMYCITYYLL